ncbi:alpha/beta fold hydrolase [Acidimangrovimonas sediminis]|uniref:alpha/beta fold hydrolase n=1 Tax=Acidimangrovimonas sediminis TaxID=2056283 RepID=UPI000C800A1A|nr:alpha/beta fold hydrolase [Acidimangrovimonas sediminis]
MPEPLVLIPGMMCDARAVWHQTIALSAERAVTVAPPVAGTTVEEMAVATLDQSPARFALAGQGLGANVALEMLRRAPERISRIALIAFSAQADPSAQSVAREPRIVGAQAGRLAEVMREEVPEAWLADGDARPEILGMLRDMALTLGEGVFVRQSRALQRRGDQQAVLRRATLPALVICGADDPATLPRRHHFMAELMPQARCVEIVLCGHLPTMEQPEIVTGVLEDWLRAPLPAR